MREYQFHTINMGDVDDPEIYAAMPINDWQQTEQGQWVMENCSDPQFRITTSPQSWGFQVQIYGPLSDESAVFFKLKWSDK